MKDKYVKLLGFEDIPKDWEQYVGLNAYVIRENPDDPKHYHVRSQDCEGLSWPKDAVQEITEPLPHVVDVGKVNLDNREDVEKAFFKLVSSMEFLGIPMSVAVVVQDIRSTEIQVQGPVYFRPFAAKTLVDDLKEPRRKGRMPPLGDLLAMLGKLG